MADTKQTVPLVGIDIVGEGNDRDATKSGLKLEHPEEMLKYLGDFDSVWVSESLKRTAGDQVKLIVNDQPHEYTVRGTFPDSNGGAPAVVMDLAAAQRAVNRFGVIDRILISVPRTEPIEEWQRRLAQTLPAGVEVRPVGTATNENRKMLGAFRWNLRLLSYIALIVGAFLIYNTISVSVVRRRADIGIVRALGASQGAVLAAFLGEAASLGAAGTLIGLPLGRVMASGAVKLMSGTVEALYVTQPAGFAGVERGFRIAGGGGGNRRVGGVGVFASARGVAGFAGRGDGAGTAGVCGASSQAAGFCAGGGAWRQARWRHRGHRRSRANRCWDMWRHCC